MVHDFPQSNERKTAIDVLLWLAVTHPQTGPTSPRLGRYLFEYQVLEKIHRTQLDGKAWAEYAGAVDLINNQHIEFAVQSIREANRLDDEYQARLAARRAAAHQLDPGATHKKARTPAARSTAPTRAARGNQAAANNKPAPIISTA